MPPAQKFGPYLGPHQSTNPTYLRFFEVGEYRVTPMITAYTDDYSTALAFLTQDGETYCTASVNLETADIADYAERVGADPGQLIFLDTENLSPEFLEAFNSFEIADPALTADGEPVTHAQLYATFPLYVLRPEFLDGAASTPTPYEFFKSLA